MKVGRAVSYLLACYKFVMSDWFWVVQAFCDLEPIYTYEGTYDINTLVAGREITGIPSFKPAALNPRRSSRL